MKLTNRRPAPLRVPRAAPTPVVREAAVGSDKLERVSGARMATQGASFGRSVSRAVAGVALGAMLLTGCSTSAPQVAVNPMHTPVAASLVSVPAAGPSVDVLKIEEVAQDTLAGVRLPARPAVDPTGLLGQVESGRFALEVPVRAGTHKISGHDIEVRPGTRMRVSVEVRDGQVVPTDSRATTGVWFTPSLEGPLWTGARGLYLKKANDGAGELIIDVRGFFDQQLARSPNGLKITDLMASLPSGGGEGLDPASLLDLDQVRFIVDEARLAPGPVELGELALDLAPGNIVSMGGSTEEAWLDGQVRIQSGKVDGQDIRLQLGEGELGLRVHGQRAGDQLTVDTRLADLDLRVPTLSAKSTGGNRLELSNVALDGVIETHAKFTIDGDEMQASEARATFEGGFSGNVRRAELNADSGRIRFSGQLEARGAIGDDALRMRARLSDARLELSDVKRSGVVVQHARFAGSGELVLGEGAAPSLHIDAHDLDVQLQDLRSQDGNLDLAPTRIEGAGRVRFDEGGYRLEGDLRASGAFDELRSQSGSGESGVIIDLAAGSSFEGRISRLEVPTSGAPTLDGRLRLGLELERAKLGSPGLSLSGHGHLRGPADVRLRGGNLQLANADTELKLVLSDGRVGGTSDLDLDFAAGSEAVLELTGLDARSGQRPQFTLREGSRLDLRLDSGQLGFGGRTLSFDPGTKARFELERFHQGPEPIPELEGSLVIDAPLDLGVAPAERQRADRLDLRGPSAAGIRIDGVRLHPDGRFTLEGVDMHLEAQTGDIEAVEAHRRLRLHALLGRDPSLKTQQDLINHFYEAGGGTWAGAAEAAEAYGLSLSELTRDRPRSTEQLLPADRMLNATFARSPMELPSLEQVREMSAAELAGMNIDTTQLDVWEIARQVEQGTLQIEVPMVGSLESVDFDPGTVLTINLQIRDGELKKEDFEARLNQSGDAPLFTTLDGAYIDDDRNLKLDVGWWFDPTAPGMEALPLQWSAIVDRLHTAASGGGEGSNPFDWANAKISVRGAELAADSELPLPGGRLRLGEGGRVDLGFGPDGVRAGGTIHGDSLEIGTEDFAIRARDARVNVDVRTTQEADGRHATRVRFAILGGNLDKLAYRGADGAHLSLEDGRALGQVELVHVTGGEKNPETSVDLNLSRFEGTIANARLLSPSGVGEEPGQVEIVDARLSGRLRADSEGGVQISGQVEAKNVGLRGLRLGTPNGDLDISDARLYARGLIDYRPGSLIAKDGELGGAAVLKSSPQDVELGGGILSNLSVENGRAVVRLSVSHFDEVRHSIDEGLVMKGLEGRVGGHGQADKLRGRIAPPTGEGPGG